MKLYYNGDILTMEEELYASAVVVDEGRIVAVGSYETLMEAYRDAKRIDLKGRCLMPAFLDAHSHITAFSNTLGLVHLEQCQTFDDIVQTLQDYVKQHSLQKDEWIIGFGYDHNFLKEKQHPDRFVLDEVSLDHPIVITHISGHMGVVNTKALELLGITEETCVSGGLIGRDASGQATGYLEEKAFMEVSSHMPPATLEQVAQRFSQAEDIYLQNGITTAQDGLTKAADWSILKMLASRQKLRLDIVSYIDVKDHERFVDDNQEYVNQYVNHLKIGGYKVILDGSPQGRTAWLTRPYLPISKQECGYPVYTDDQVKSFIRTAIDHNVQLLAHCNGDAAADQFLNCFHWCCKKYKVDRVMRPVMIHAQTVRDDQLERMKSLGMIPSFFIAHTYYWGDVHLKNLGEERAFHISPVKEAIANDLVYTFHQDTPVILPNMLETIWCAVNRVSKNGIVMGRKEQISTLEALRGVTIYAAYQYFEEEQKGSIRPGKLADLVILDRNPLKVDPMRLKQIQVVETIKNGETLYQKK